MFTDILKTNYLLANLYISAPFIETEKPSCIEDKYLVFSMDYWSGTKTKTSAKKDVIDEKELEDLCT